MSEASGPQHLGLPLVYLVDDEPVVRDALAWLLRSRRLLSESFANADAFDAWLLTRDFSSSWPDSPSCVLLDVRMPGTSGLALFDSLIERDLIQRLPVIFLTGHGDVPTAVAAVKRGAFDFVEKPFSDNALRSGPVRLNSFPRFISGVRAGCRRCRVVHGGGRRLRRTGRRGGQLGAHQRFHLMRPGPVLAGGRSSAHLA